MGAGGGSQAEHELGDPRGLESRGQSQREQRDARFGAHRGDVAEVHVQRPVPDVGSRSEVPPEVDVLDQHVGRQHVDMVAARPYHRRIVTDAEQHVGRRRAAGDLGDPADQGVLAHVADRGRRGMGPRRKGRRRHGQRAISTARVSRMTVTLIWPG